MRMVPFLFALIASAMSCSPAPPAAPSSQTCWAAKPETKSIRVIIAPDGFNAVKWVFSAGAHAEGYLAGIDGEARGIGLSVTYEKDPDPRIVSVVVSVLERFTLSEPASYGGEALALVRSADETIDAIHVSVDHSSTNESLRDQVSQSLVAALIRSAKVAQFLARTAVHEEAVVAAVPTAPTDVDPTPPRIVIEFAIRVGTPNRRPSLEPTAFAVPGTHWRCQSEETFDVSPVPGNPLSVPFVLRSHPIECTTGDASAV